MIHGAKALGRLHRSGLFWRFLLIGIAVLAPLAGALVQLAGDERRMTIEATRKRAELLISYAIDSQDHVIDEAGSVLRFLADMPEVRSGGPSCDAFLKRYLGLQRWMMALRLSNLDGSQVCGDQIETDAGRRDFLSTVLKAKSFVLSNLIVDPRTGTLSMIAAVPVRQGDRVIGVLSADVNPGIFGGRSPARIDPDLDVHMLVVDRRGTLIAHYPPAEKLVGADLRERPVVRRALEVSQGSIEASDLFGAPRLFVFRTLPGTDAVIAIGLNRLSVIAAIDETLRYRLVLITVIVLGSLLLGMLGVEGLIFRPLRHLVQTAEAFEHGNFNIRSSQKGAGEVRILSRALNRMAEAVADRERELMEAKEVAENALGRANIASKAKTDFLASMSHEIRTPLNGIIGYTERLLEEKLNARQRRYADLIQVSASALLTVANDILDFSSIEADQIRLQAEPFSLVSLVDDTVSIVSSGAGKKGVPIQISLDPGLPKMVLGDEARLRQILLNLLNNAVKFTREGHITTLVQHKGRSGAGEVIRISIIDTGIGIAPEKHDRLFKRFSQIDPSIRREFGGTGLGLAISKRLIELMGGEIGLESKEGQGSTFWIELTLPNAAERSPAQKVAGPFNTAPARILLVEDIEINQELVQTLLETAGHEVDVVSNGEDAIAAVQARAYDLVLMDIQMPGMDGITATKQIRALEQPASRTLIVAMTANVLPQQVRTFIEAGIDDHIGKPVKRDDLLARLSLWLPEKSSVALSMEDISHGRTSFHEDCFRSFRDTIGADRIGLWLTRFDEQLSSAFAGDDPQAADREQVARSAHALTSQAALLGFPELAELCTLLEQACVGGGDFSVALEAVRRAARDARKVIVGMKPAVLA
jgi:signal transduction histidine kinase/DNA-binding response OmpR family regulator